MFWVEEFQEMVYFIIINWFNWSGVWIWNWLRVRFIWKPEGWTSTSPLLMKWWFSLPMIAETKGLVFGEEVMDLKWAAVGCLLHYIGGSFVSSPWKALDWFIFILILGGMKFRSTDDAGIILVSNTCTEFSNIPMYHAESYNNWLEICCIIADVIWRTKMMRALTCSGQYSWGSNSF